ncbi:CBS domain-containing CBSCBSPB5 -like protein [Gossypium arboreum]|uniref:CBS domain-containing CBSCBSPB5-like protein n=1 Tax=Gossypium arboreum TaxID=29729 RepID=A0A0B0PKS0_GOSAR|nr:CBS domain-containing CBSCBSPB5 -like protein [Gossypium arboreum]
MASQSGSTRRSSSIVNLSSSRKKTPENGGSESSRKFLQPSRPINGTSCINMLLERGLAGERTVKKLRLSKALTVPDSTSIYEACRRMAARRVDALLLTDSNALLCGILTDKDIATRVIARELNLEETPVSKVMTKNPVFVLSDTLAVEALQKMVQGKFRHLPVVENGEVIALLDIAKCLYDAIARMERAAEKGKAIAAAVEGVEKNWGASFSGQSTFIETLRERMFRPSLSTIITDNPKIVTVSPDDTVLAAAKKMLESRLNSAVVTVENKPRGILTSKDILMRVIAQNMSPETTLVEKVMTPNPECATIDTPIVDALHTMHDGKFLHLPVVDRDGEIVAVFDVIHITHAAVATLSQVGSTSGVNNEATTTMMQKFWDSAMALPPTEEDDETSRSDVSVMEQRQGDLFPILHPICQIHLALKYKIKGAECIETRSLTDLITAILQRLEDDIDRNNLPQILYEDEDHDKVVLASDGDLAAAVEHAKLVGWKGLKLHLDYSGTKTRRRGSDSGSMDYANSDAWSAAYSTVAAGAAVVAGLGLLAYLRKAGN